MQNEYLKNLLPYLICSQIWLILLTDDHQFGYFKKELLKHLGTSHTANLSHLRSFCLFWGQFKMQNNPTSCRFQTRKCREGNKSPGNTLQGLCKIRDFVVSPSSPLDIKNSFKSRPMVSLELIYVFANSMEKNLFHISINCPL